MTRRLFQHSAMMQKASHVAVRHNRSDSAFFQDFEVAQGEKAAVRTHLSRRLATLALHPVYHWHQQPAPAKDILVRPAEGVYDSRTF